MCMDVIINISICVTISYVFIVIISFISCIICVTRVIIRTVSFHNIKSQNLKLSVSNPKSKYVAYVSVLSQISNCQSLGRNNKHEILKTDRSTHWKMSLKIPWMIPVKIHWKSDNPLEDTSEQSQFVGEYR